jgi:uncharacterized protein DUF4357
MAETGPGQSSSGGRSVRLFLADGTPHGLIVADIGNWNGKVLAGPRSRIVELLRRPEANRTGVYVQIGPDPDRLGELLGYIGEADDVAARMRHHLRSDSKDFFERVAFVVSSDEALTKAHARYLESRLIRLTKDAGTVVLTNDTAPDFNRLPEADRADMETFIEQLRIILPLVGFDLFRPRRPVWTAPAAGADSAPTFTFSTGAASARARETEAGFVVLAGSTAKTATSGTFQAGYRALRERLAADGSLVPGASDDLLTFASDVVFASPSAAAAVVAGRSASGPIEWKIAETGQAYRDWRIATLE